VRSRSVGSKRIRGAERVADNDACTVYTVKIICRSLVQFLASEMSLIYAVNVFVFFYP
jgi:hypothetical protein